MLFSQLMTRHGGGKHSQCTVANGLISMASGTESTTKSLLVLAKFGRVVFKSYN